MNIAKYFFMATLEDGTLVTGVSTKKIKGQQFSADIIMHSEIQKDEEIQKDNIIKYKFKKNNKN